MQPGSASPNAGSVSVRRPSPSGTLGTVILASEKYGSSTLRAFVTKVRPTLIVMKLPAAVCVIFVVLFGCLASAGASTHSSSRSSNLVYFREVLCFAPGYDQSAKTSAAATKVSSCSAASFLNLKNLQTNPDVSAAAGFSFQNVPPDPALAGIPSTRASSERASMTVLLPGLPGASVGSNGVRYLLGPAQMTSKSIAHAKAYKSHDGQWVVDYSMTEDGKRLWDRVANDDFHLLLGIDYRGVVVSAPIIQPTQESFTSFNGLGEISGGFGKTEALLLGRAMNAGHS